MRRNRCSWKHEILLPWSVMSGCDCYGSRLSGVICWNSNVSSAGTKKYSITASRIKYSYSGSWSDCLLTKSTYYTHYFMTCCGHIKQINEGKVDGSTLAVKKRTHKWNMADNMILHLLEWFQLVLSFQLNQNCPSSQQSDLLPSHSYFPLDWWCCSW